ncbi:TPA: glycosyltransferase family 2 protein [Citrobacter freundii]|nr:glycosyltransferase family 2 protein [Citrobacter freundii]HCD1230875.1 glycosyltransferase family 2 protein [Citrobacter freundii]HDT6516043.1 glycosyltransferase family 2 protein [Citrobacter freundii]HEE9967591.1 glycosyltransferase family 2 protein [Citrobacter freundii]
MPTPLVSIIVTSYNHDAFLAEALESVFSQTWKNIEVIIVDDASTTGPSISLKNTSRNIIAKQYCGIPTIILRRTKLATNRSLKP